MRLKFEWYCTKKEIFTQWEMPCKGCDRKCKWLTKVSPNRGIFGKDKEFIYKRDKVCLKCGTENNLTIDHIIPISKKGTNDRDNLQVLCSRCNGEKDDKTIDYR